MWPSVSSTTPLPMSPLLPACTVMVTTDGSILAAAALIVPSRTGLLAAGTVVTLIGEVAEVLGAAEVGVRADAGARADDGGERGGHEDAAAAPAGALEQGGRARVGPRRRLDRGGRRAVRLPRVGLAPVGRAAVRLAAVGLAVRGGRGRRVAGSDP